MSRPRLWPRTGRGILKSRCAGSRCRALRSGSYTVVPRRTLRGEWIVVLPGAVAGDLAGPGSRLWLRAQPGQVVMTVRPSGPNPGRPRTTVRLRQARRRRESRLAESVRARWTRNRNMQLRLTGLTRSEEEM